ncbi:F0F1 ATP synthase subunit delta [Propioniciclava soli]|uniref:ATP synthase subunit delta n=1 Tax=Propioniciclava soli TaxID=2775081 RepID=A0ABZ3C458_9ACTN|nr:F0F1 ATP synthase subunit delta [Propioniciclava soli]
MSAAAASRLSALDGVLDARTPSVTLALELFELADAIAVQPALRRALTDPGTPDDARADLVGALFGPRTGPDAVAVLAETARTRWSTPREFVAALERQAVRALLVTAQGNGELDEVEDQLFHIERLVDAHPDLRSAISDRRSSLTARADLIGGLVDGRVLPVVAQLARRAVAAHRRTFALTVEEYLTLAADLRSRAVATVEVARPLTDEQLDRLTTALSRQAGRDVTVRVVVDPSVIGGARVTLGDEVIEGTVAGRLHDAHRKLG